MRRATYSALFIGKESDYVKELMKNREDIHELDVVGSVQEAFAAMEMRDFGLIIADASSTKTKDFIDSMGQSGNQTPYAVIDSLTDQAGNLDQQIIANDLADNSSPINELLAGENIVKIPGMSAILNGLPDAVLVMNQSGKVVFVNKTANELFGIEDSGLELSSFNDLLISYYTEKEEVVTTFELSDLELNEKFFGWCKRADGKRFPAQVQLSELDHSQNTAFVLATIRQAEAQFDLENKVRRSDEQFRYVFDAMIDLFIVIDKQGTITTASPSITEMLGYTPEEVLGKSVEDFCVDTKSYQQIAAILKRDHSCKKYEIEIFAKNGASKTLSVNANCFFLNTGEFRGVDCVVQDITESTVLKQEVNYKNLLLENAQNMSNLGIWEWDVQTQVVTWSKELYNIFGVNKHRHTPSFETYAGALHPEDREFVLSTIQEVVTSGGQFELLERIIRPNGEIRYLKTWGQSIDNEKNQIVFGACLDITESVRNKEALFISERRLALINENSPDVILTVNKELEITYLNRPIPGTKLHDVISKNILSYVLPDSRDYYKARIEEAFKGINQDFRLEGIDANGNRAWYDVRMFLLQKDTATPELLTITRDVTAIRAAEKRNEIINAVSRRLNMNMDISEFCGHVFQELKRLFNFSQLYISNLDAKSGQLEVSLSIEEGESNRELYTKMLDAGLSQKVFELKEGLVIQSDDLMEHYTSRQIQIIGNPPQSWIGVPLISDGSIVGVLAGISMNSEGEFDESDLEFWSFLGAQIGSFVERNNALSEIKQFQNFFSVSTDMLCITDAEGYFRVVNPKFYESLGYTEHELLANTIYETIHPEDEEATRMKLQNVSKDKTVVDFMNRYRCQNGEYKWLLWSAAPDPETGLIFAAAKDVSEQIRLRESLRALTDIQNTFIHGIPEVKEPFGNMLKLILDMTQSNFGFIGEVETINGKQSITTLGFEGREQSSEQIEFYHDFVLEHGDKLLGRVIDTESYIILNNLQRFIADNEITGVYNLENFIGLPFFDNKELVGVICVANKTGPYNEDDLDMLEPFIATCATLVSASRNEKIRREAVEEAGRLASIVSHSNDAIVSTDNDLHVMSWNHGAEELFGYSAEEMIGQPIAELFMKDAPLIKGLFEEVKQGHNVEGYETVQRTKNGAIMPVSMSIFPLIDEKGTISGISGILRDITAQQEAIEMKERFTRKLEVRVSERTAELQRAKTKLAKSLEREKELGVLKSRFVSTASHQFRTPLTVIQSNMGVLEMEIKKVEGSFVSTFHRAQERIKQQISRMTNIMDDVLIIGKINAGKVILDFSPVNLIELCEEVTKNYNEIGKGEAVIFESFGNAYDFQLDRKLMEQVLSNLVSNSIKYSRNSNPPVVTLRYEDEGISISVKDAGIGMSESDLEHVFEPFYRASNALEITGTGLGTTIAKEYVELNGGTISVRSELNKGTEFVIDFKAT